MRWKLARRILFIGLVTGLAGLAGCSERAPPLATQQVVPRPVADPAVLNRGKTLFKQHCAACHGELAQGAIAWERPGPDGKYPPPPLNGTGHDWHHPREQLRQTIREGTLHIGGNMPAWRTTLTEPDIAAVIIWFQSLWPDPIYAAWVDIDRRARAGEGGR